MADNVINPTAKAQFIADPKRVSSHNSMVQIPQMRDSLNMALLEYQRIMIGNLTDANAGAAVSFKLKGAEEFINIFLSLGMTRSEPKIVTPITLDHRA